MRSISIAFLICVGFSVAGCMMANQESAAPSPQAAASSTPAYPSKLQCEYQVNPLGVDLAQPRLSWILESDPSARGVVQAAYQILVASSSQTLAWDQGDLWDSGKVASSETNQISYQGKPLASGQVYFWKARTWDASGQPSVWSDPSQWTMGLLKPEDWHAKWIMGSPDLSAMIFRHEFAVKPGLKRATIFICGLGQYELTIDGKKVGDDVLAPGWTKYDKTCLYDTRDLSPFLNEGKNGIGIQLGSGMYNVPGVKDRYTKFRGSFGPLKVIAQIQLEYADGTSDVIGTDSSWRTSLGPITLSHVYAGEDYDARLVQAGWDSPGFDDSKWSAAVETQGPGGELRGLSCAAPPIRTFEVFKPLSMKKLRPTTQVYDMGQNAAIIPRITVKGPAGSVIRIVPSELIKADGTPDRSSFGSTAKTRYWQYTLAGAGQSENWFPKFFYHGARYLEVDFFPAPGSDELPQLESIESVVVQSSSPPVGQFACSSELFNRIHTLVRWAQRSNMVSIMTDCPHREKMGWLEEDHLNGPSLRYEFDLASLFTKVTNDIADSQLLSGLVPTTAPEYTIFGKGEDRNNFGDSPEWGSSAILVPWQQYEFNNDLDLLSRRYNVMKGYVEFLRGKSKNNIVSYGLGDWYDIGPNRPGISQLTPNSVTATAVYYSDVQVLAKTAALLGKKEDAQQYNQLGAQIRDAFNHQFYNPQTHQYATGSQCANSMALVTGLAEDSNRAAVLDNIVKDVRSDGNALTAGDVGYRYLLRALADGGRSDVIFDINNQSDKPGYGMQLKRGATSLTEGWDALRTSSQNHFMLGQIVEWMYHDLAGIQSDPAGPGFRKIIIKPAIVGDLNWVKASYDSINGKIESIWRKENGSLRLDVTIPVNTTAALYIPAKSPASITESGHPLDQAKGVKVLKSDANTVQIEIGSGQYQFAVK
ncbi:MAG TPA: family 78 glycoside hydrolase catalytic domain [Tepidisphaeraceae bacterium]|nr:family 78 glycoside hydrolase catalytic domain [Tepidisphaeraceae bacterium]